MTINIETYSVSKPKAICKVSALLQWEMDKYQWILLRTLKYIPLKRVLLKRTGPVKCTGHAQVPGKCTGPGTCAFYNMLKCTGPVKCTGQYGTCAF